MKRVLFGLIIASNAVFGQNIDEQNVSFQYAQKPLYLINQAVPYEVELDLVLYNQKREDSLTRYEYVKGLYDRKYENWLYAKNSVDKTYFLDMSAWEKARMSNASLPQPVRAPYSEQPFKDEQLFPIVPEKLDQAIAEKTIQLAGFNKGEDGVKLIFIPEGLSNVKIETKGKNAGFSSKTKYSLSYSNPYSIKILLPNGEEIYTKRGGEELLVFEMGSFANEYEYEYWKVDNYNQMWQSILQNSLVKSLQEANNDFNGFIGLPIKQIDLAIYTVKKFKNFDYSDFTKAYTFAKDGYLSLTNGSQETANAQLKKAIEIWERAERESALDERKTRINKKVSAVVYVNLAQAYMWSKDFNKADYYIQKAIDLGVFSYDSVAQKLKTISDEMRNRELANK